MENKIFYQLKDEYYKNKEVLKAIQKCLYTRILSDDDIKYYHKYKYLLTN